MRKEASFGTGMFPKIVKQADKNEAYQIELGIFDQNQVDEILQIDLVDSTETFFTTLQVSSKSVKFEVDSGAAVTY